MSVKACGACVASSVLAVLGFISLGERELRCLLSFGAGSLLGDVFAHALPHLPENAFPLVLLGTVLPFLICAKKSGDKLIWTAVLGDALHNAGDGLALAAVAATTPQALVGSTVGTVVHELAQELSTLSALKAANMSKAKAAFIKILLSMTVFIGWQAHALLGEYNPYVTALAAGNFLYLGLCEMMPRAGNTLSSIFFFSLGVALVLWGHSH